MTSSATGTDLAGRNPHSLGDREAMGLPPRTVNRVVDRAGDRHPDVAGRHPDELAALAGDPSQPWERRHLAGRLLAVLGDPRIRPTDPETVAVPGATVSLGLPWSRVDEVVYRWKQYGVVRAWIEKECPRHEVTIRPFRMARYPVTNLEYRLFLEGSGRWPAPSSWPFGVYPADRSNHPVWTVEDSDAEAYACWLSSVTGRRFRLPTEAEWEYAASGGTDREYPWGDGFTEDVANTAEHGPWTTTPVGIYPAGRSPFGIDDLAGNVEEYVADDYHPYPGGVAVADDLADGDRVTYRVARGGGFSRFGDLARCARRHGRYQRAYYAVGFRLVEEST